MDKGGSILLRGGKMGKFTRNRNDAKSKRILKDVGNLGITKLNKLSSAVSSYASSATKKAYSAKDAVSSAASSAKDVAISAKDAVSSAASSAKDVAISAKDAVSSAASSTAEAASSAVSSAKNAANQIQENASQSQSLNAMNVGDVSQSQSLNAMNVGDVSQSQSLNAMNVGDASQSQPLNAMNVGNASQQQTTLSKIKEKANKFFRSKQSEPSKQVNNTSDHTSMFSNIKEKTTEFYKQNIRRKPRAPTEEVVRYYGDPLDMFTFGIVLAIMSFFIFIILKDLYFTLKLHYSNNVLPKFKIDISKDWMSSSVNDVNNFKTNDIRNNTLSESIKYMLKEKDKVLQNEFKNIQKLKSANKLDASMNSIIDVNTLSYEDDEYEYERKKNTNFVSMLFQKPKHYRLNNATGVTM
jgi:hypothetical protein